MFPEALTCNADKQLPSRDFLGFSPACCLVAYPSQSALHISVFPPVTLSSSIKVSTFPPPGQDKALTIVCCGFVCQLPKLDPAYSPPCPGSPGSSPWPSWFRLSTCLLTSTSWSSGPPGSCPTCPQFPTAYPASPVDAQPVCHPA